LWQTGSEKGESFMSDAQIAAVTNRVEELSDQQALSIVASLGGQFLEDTAPESAGEQASVLEAAYRETGKHTAIASESESSDAGRAARELLKMMAAVGELRAEVERRVSRPCTGGACHSIGFGGPGGVYRLCADATGGGTCSF
jgi:hypothetical protein